MNSESEPLNDETSNARSPSKTDNYFAKGTPIQEPQTNIPTRNPEETPSQSPIYNYPPQQSYIPTNSLPINPPQIIDGNVGFPQMMGYYVPYAPNQLNANAVMGMPYNQLQAPYYQVQTPYNIPTVGVIENPTNASNGQNFQDPSHINGNKDDLKNEKNNEKNKQKTKDAKNSKKVHPNNRVHPNNSVHPNNNVHPYNSVHPGVDNYYYYHNIYPDPVIVIDTHPVIYHRGDSDSREKYCTCCVCCDVTGIAYLCQLLCSCLFYPLKLLIRLAELMLVCIDNCYNKSCQIYCRASCAIFELCFRAFFGCFKPLCLCLSGGIHLICGGIRSCFNCALDSLVFIYEGLGKLCACGDGNLISLIGKILCQVIDFIPKVLASSCEIIAECLQMSTKICECLCKFLGGFIFG